MQYAAQGPNKSIKRIAQSYNDNVHWAILTMTGKKYCRDIGRFLFVSAKFLAGKRGNKCQILDKNAETLHPLLYDIHGLWLQLHLASQEY